MDKYEQAVKEYLQNPIFEWTTQEMIEEEFMRFARYYEDKYLAEALAAAAMMREKETCEWKLTYQGIEGFGTPINNYTTFCGFTHWGLHHLFCPNCGRRIVEKEEK
jgi:hypothetical protein